MVYKVTRHISSNEIELLNKNIDQENPDKLVIDILEYKRARLFAEARALGFLKKLQDRNVPIIIKIGVNLDSFSNEEVNKYWKIFFESVFGFLLVQFAEKIVSPSNENIREFVINEQKKFLRANGGYFGSGKEICAISVDKFGYPPGCDLLNVTKIENFSPKFRKFFRNMMPLIPSLKVGFELWPIIDFTFELVQNSFEHGLIDINNKAIDGLRFLTIRRLNIIEEYGETIKELSGQAGGAIGAYLIALKESGIIEKNFNDSLLEITIADSGIGIPARMTKNLNIYDKDIDLEKKELLLALTTGGSSKPQSLKQEGAGIGLWKVMLAIYFSKGLILFRTGRLEMYRHYVGKNYNKPETEIELDLLQDTYPNLIRGTSISILIPWVNKDFNQYGLEL